MARPAVPVTTLAGDWYQHPAWYDLAFAGETAGEADFIEAACRQFGRPDSRTLFEPGCGTGRLALEMARRGYRVCGLDLSPDMLRYARTQAEKAGLTEHLTLCEGDMTQFTLPEPFTQIDAAFNPVNTFRHLLTEAAVQAHLDAVAHHLRPGGLYIIGLHLTPTDEDFEVEEKWRATDGVTEVSVNVELLEFNEVTRQEVVRFDMTACPCNADGKPNRRKKTLVRSDVRLRTYTAGQLHTLVASRPDFELCGVFDFWYQIDDPLELSTEMEDCVLVLRKTLP